MSHDQTIDCLKELIIECLKFLKDHGKLLSIRLPSRRTSYGKTFFTSVYDKRQGKNLCCKCFSGFESNFFEVKIFGLIALLHFIKPNVQSDLRRFKINTSLKVLILLPFGRHFQMVRLIYKVPRKSEKYFLQDITNKINTI